MCELINTLNVLVSCTQLVHSIGVDKLGHIGACALPIGGCAQPLEMSPTHIKTTPSYHVLSLGDQYIEYVCGRRLNLGWIKWAMLRLSGKLTVFDSISLGVTKGSETELHRDCRRHWSVNRRVYACCRQTVTNYKRPLLCQGNFAMLSTPLVNSGGFQEINSAEIRSWS